MPPFIGDRDQAVREIAAVEQALSEGYPPQSPPGNNKIKSAVSVATERLGVVRMTLHYRIGKPDKPGSIFRHFGLKVDWSKYKPGAITATADGGPPSDPIDLRRLRDRVAQLSNDLRAAERRTVEAENWREMVLGLRDMPMPPVSFPAPPHSRGDAETVVLFLSDLQWGEVVDRDELNGLNSFDRDIAVKRLGRWTHAVIDLVTKHWAGPPPDRIILILGGDLISGGIHLELAKTDELQPLPAVRDVADHLRQAILTIKAAVKCEIVIVSIPGNHGRMTIKPESKKAVQTSLDILVSDFLEMGLKDRKGIRFTAPLSVDALFTVYGWRILATHGDRIGSRGGQGYIGPAATIARGMKRVIHDYAARGIHIDLIIVGHQHTPLQLEEGFANGSLPGPTEFSRDGRYRPHPAQQLFFTMHPRHRIAQIRWIEVGSPEEGSLYVPPPADAPPPTRFSPHSPSARGLS